MAEGLKDDKFCKRIDFSSGNLSAAWKTFKMQFDIYKIAKKYAAMSEPEQISNMLVQMGNESVPIYAQFEYDESVENKKETLANTIRMFDNYFEPVKNVIYERAKFNTMKQGEKSIHQYIVELQNQADQCEYGTVKGDLVRDRIVVGVRDSKLREYLIDLDDLDLHKCIQKAKQWVSNHQQTSKFNEGNDENIDYVSSRQDYKKKAEYSSAAYPSADSPCKFCLKSFHRGKICPAKHTMCKVCSEKGHWAKSVVCKKKGKSISELNSRMTDHLVEETDSLFLADDL